MTMSMNTSNTNNPSSTNELFTTGQAAAYLGVGFRTLQRWDANGKLKPTLRVGPRRDRRYSKEDLDAFAPRLSQRGTKQAPKTAPSSKDTDANTENVADILNGIV